MFLAKISKILPGPRSLGSPWLFFLLFGREPTSPSGFEERGLPAEKVLRPTLVLGIPGRFHHELGRRHALQILGLNAIAQGLQSIVYCLGSRHDRLMALQCDTRPPPAQIIEIA